MIIMKILAALLAAIFVALLVTPVTEGKRQPFDDDRRHNLLDHHQPMIHKERHPNSFGRKVLNSAEVTSSTDDDDDVKNVAHNNTHLVGSDPDGEQNVRTFIGRNKTAGSHDTNDHVHV
ncbi:hypothetical protein PanWU01x14_121070 [Parasponia andersonii]|uniref:Transmembrane protein n=1 Tax=Parasponia andersonii TaxID=3476 RepID=A0A2P5CV52_PARAD|nr:hypothetical protein PanWU01x14_121070 [Parasponia andersonii]